MAPTQSTTRIIILLLTAILGWYSANAQSLKLGVKGGVLYMVSTESSDGRQDIYTLENRGFGFGPWAPWISLDVRYSPPRGRVALVADATYSWLRGDGTIDWVESSGNDYSSGGDFKSALYVVSGGPQWNLLMGPVQPYLGFRLMWTHMADVSKSSAVIPFGGFDRFGLGLLGGATIELNSSVALDVSSRYNFTNISSPGGYNPYFNGLYIGAGLLFEVL